MRPASSKCFGFVTGYDKKPKRRLYELLHSQGMQNNQKVTFLSDGGDSVREIQLYLNPEAEYILDWFHVSMRLTVIGQFVKSLLGSLPASTAVSNKTKAKAKSPTKSLAPKMDEVLEAAHYPSPSELEKELERVKWYLWHGNALKALQVLDLLETDLWSCEEDWSLKGLAYQKLSKAVREFNHYIRVNQAYIVNYGDHYRNGEKISSSIAESTVNQVISKRFVKKQQMRWTKKGVHLLLQLRTKLLNGELEPTFQRWYLGMKPVLEMKGQAEEQERIAC